MALPIVSGFEVNTPVGGVPIDATSFRRAALQGGRAAAGIGAAVGDTFQQLTDQIQQARNAKTVFDADSTLKQTKLDFLDRLSKDPNLAKDPGTWLPAFKETAKQTIDGIMSQPNLGPAVKRHLSQMTSNWENDNALDIQYNALKREASDTKEAGMMSANLDLNMGTDKGLADAITKYKAMNERGVIGPQTLKALIEQAPKTSAAAKAEIAINRFPIDSPKIVEGIKELDPDDRRMMMRRANEAMHGAQAAALDDFSQQMDDDPDHKIPKGLKAARDANQISEKGYEALVARSERLVKADKAEAAREDREQGLVIGLSIANENFKGLTNRNEVRSGYMDQINAVQDIALRTRLTNDLNRKMDEAEKEGRNDEKGLHAEITEMGRNAFNQGLFRGPKSVDVTEEVPSWWNKFGIGTPETKVVGQKTVPRSPETGWQAGASQADIYKATLAHAEFQAKMDKFFRDYPDAKPAEAIEYAQKLIEPSVVDQVKQALAPNANPAKGERRKQNGVVYEFDGKNWNEVR
jgi:hypothetical protein